MHFINIQWLNLWISFLKENVFFSSLAKVADRNSFWANQNYSDSFQYLYPTQCESFRTNPKNVLYLVWWKPVKNRSDLIRFNPRKQCEWIRTNPKPSFQSESIRGRKDSNWFWLKIRFGSIRARIDLDWFGLIRIVASDYIGLDWIEFLPFFIKRATKRLSDWFWMIRIGSDTDIGMNRNSSDWLGMNSYPILSPGHKRIFFIFYKSLIIFYKFCSDFNSGYRRFASTFVQMSMQFRQFVSWYSSRSLVISRFDGPIPIRIRPAIIVRLNNS